MLDRDIDLLRPLPIFAHFDEDQLRLIAFSAERKEFESGAVVFREGELADSGLLVGAETYARNLEDAVAAGVLGSPFYIVTDTGQKFWGQDRLDHLQAHLEGRL